jgi:hypothetical protein
VGWLHSSGSRQREHKRFWRAGGEASDLRRTNNMKL